MDKNENMPAQPGAPANTQQAPTLMSLDTHQSVYRERLLEHLLIGELLKHSWLHHGAALEVSQPAIDRSGHDVVLEDQGVMRHVQLKASSLKATTSSQTIHLGLAAKASGCVVWTRFDSATMCLGPFMVFGGEPGAPLPSLEEFKLARHAKGDAKGEKKIRPKLRVIPVARFARIDDIAGLYEWLFGPPAARNVVE